MMKRFLILVSFVLLTGCGSRLPLVEGTVTLDGDPVPDARIVFESPGAATATAKTDEDGHFTVVTASEQGMAEGSYKVTVSAYKKGEGGYPTPNLATPKKYNSTETSGLTADIVAGKNTVELELSTGK